MGLTNFYYSIIFTPALKRLIKKICCGIEDIKITEKPGIVPAFLFTPTYSTFRKFLTFEKFGKNKYF